MIPAEDAPPLPAARPLLLLIADDLLFPSRIREAVKPLDLELRVVATEAAARAVFVLSPPPRAILVNLNARRLDPVALIGALKADPATAGVPLLAFAGHVETAKHEDARAAGADLVATNSSVSLHLGKLLDRLWSSERSAATKDAVVEITDAT